MLEGCLCKKNEIIQCCGKGIQTRIENALKELESSKPMVGPLIDALQVAQSYLLTSPQGADRKILDRINDEIKKPQPPQELKATLEAILLYLSKPPLGLMKCKYCGCTDDYACEGGCSWVAKDVCSKCAASFVSVIKMADGALLRTEGNPKSPRPAGCSIQTTNLFEHQIKDLFVPLEAMIFTAESLLNTYQEITGEKIRLKLGAEPKKESEIRMIPALCPGCNKPIEFCTGQFRLCVNRDHVKYPDPEIEELRRRKP